MVSTFKDATGEQYGKADQVARQNHIQRAIPSMSSIHIWEQASQRKRNHYEDLEWK